MSSFIATARTATTEPPEAVVNDGFFPNLTLQAVRAAVRLDGTVTDERLRAALVAAVIEVGNDLAAWKAMQQARGHADLAAIPAVQIDGASRLTHAYLRAVTSLTRANLIERMQDYDTTHAGQKRADALADPAEDCRRDARWAVADVLGSRRNVVDLI